MRPQRYAVLLASLAAVNGCAVGPDYRRPEIPQPAAFREAWQTAAPADQAPRGPWWRTYTDASLDGLEEDAVRANQTLQSAAAQHRGALAAVGVSRAARFPTVGASASTARGSSGGAGASPATTGTYTVDRLTAALSWEIDLWGRLRRQLEQSRDTAEASAGDLAAAQLLASATLAQDYVQLRALDMQRDLLGRTIIPYRRSLEITRNRYAAGVSPRTDVTQAESQLAAADAQDADYMVQRATLEHAVAVLAGHTPEEFVLPPVAALPVLPPIPEALPATLLERRPDVSAAERRVAAANAAVGVARAAWFPTLSLSGSGGFQGPQWQHLVSVPMRYWSVGPALAETLFDAGARHYQSVAAVAGYDRAVADYRQVVLTALAEVEDRLVALRGLAEEAAADERAAAAARETLMITENQYRAGTVSYLNVVIAESTTLAAERNLIDVRSRQLLAHIGLLKAMGGSPVP